MTQPFPHTPAQLREGLVHLGVTAGQVVMLHTSVKAVGPVLGGPNTIIQSLLDVLTPDGTLMMYVGWQDIPDWLDEIGYSGLAGRDDAGGSRSLSGASSPF